MADDKKKPDSSSSSDLTDNGIFLLMEEIDEVSCRDAIEFILEANLEKEPEYDHLTLIINSPGGSLVDGFALIDVMAGSRVPVHTVGIGMICSMGLLIFMAGKKGSRVLTPNTTILSHQFWSVGYGKEHELLAARKKNDLMSKMIVNHYKKHTNIKDPEKLKKVLLPESDVWLTAEEAQEYGLCDEIRYLDNDTPTTKAVRKHGKKA